MLRVEDGDPESLLPGYTHQSMLWSEAVISDHGTLHKYDKLT